MLDKMVDGEMIVQKIVAFLLHLKVFGEFAEKVHERVVRADVLEPGFYKLHYLALLLIRRLLYAASGIVAYVGGNVVFTEDPEILVPGLEERALRRGLRFLADLVAVGEVVEGVEKRTPQTEGKIGCPFPHGPVDLQSRFVETELVNDRVHIESHEIQRPKFGFRQPDRDLSSGFLYVREKLDRVVKMRGLDAVNEEVVQKAKHLRFALQLLKTLEERKEDFLHFRGDRISYSLSHNFRRKRSGVL